MIAFAGMLIEYANEAGMAHMAHSKDIEDTWHNAENKAKYPHFFVYCQLQLGASLPYPSAHWDNAKVIAALSLDEIKTITFEQLVEKGFAVGNSSLYA